MSGCSGRISLPCGRSTDMQVRLHIRHSLPGKQVFPKGFSSALPVCVPWHAGKNLLWSLTGSSLLPPPCRASDSQQKSGRISVLHPPRMDGVSTPGRARRRKTAYLRRAKKTCGPFMPPGEGRFRMARGHGKTAALWPFSRGCSPKRRTVPGGFRPPARFQTLRECF